MGHDPTEVVGTGAELGVVVAFGRLVPVQVLSEVPMVNLHFSLLPRWRGAAPVERAILAGDTETGVCLMAVEEGLDTGGVYRRARVAVDEEVTADELRAELVEVGTALLVDALDAGLGPAEPQPEDGVTYAAKLRAEDRRIDFGRNAVDVQRVVRIGGAWTTFRGARLKVLRTQVVAASGSVAGEPGRIAADLVVGTGDGSGVQLLEVQPEGRGPMDAGSWANGARPVGERLGE